MQILRRTALLAALAVVPACNGGAPAPAAQPATPAPAKAEEAPKVAAAAPADKAADDKKGEGEEGCIHGGDMAKKEHEPEAEGCGGHGEAPATGVPGHFGAAFALKDTKPLAQILASGKDALPKDAVQVSGQIDSVCQKMGCWMVVKDGEMQARILMKDHSFTVPTDVKGKGVVVEGTLEARTFSEAQVKHLEKDGGGDPAKASGERTEFVLTASGVQLANS